MRQTALFFDVGGVLLTNGWDRTSRASAAERFALDPAEFQRRHELVISDFDCGRIGVDEYLDQTIFHQPREFTREAFRDFMRAQSQPYPEALAFVSELARSGEYLMAALNNESKELNDYRIERFGLADHFELFFSSCFLGVRKPEEKIYQIALQVTRRSPPECLLIDDRPENVEGARRAGMPAIQYQDVAQLREELRRRT